MRPDVIALLDRWGLDSLHWLVPTSGVMYAVAFFVGGLMLRRRARQAGLPQHHVLDIWIVGGGAAAVGARCYYLLIHGELFGSSLRNLVGHAGTGSWGAYAGASLGLAVYCLVTRLEPWRWLDVVASIAPLAEVAGRWSCWLVGDDFGRVTNVPWAIRFPAGSLAWQAHLARGLLAATAPTSLPVHPQQFYLMANALAVFLVVSAIWKRNEMRPGITFAAYLLLYGASRFWWELLRDPAAGGAASGLSSSQIMCILFVGAGGALLLLRRRTAVVRPGTRITP